jgi:hypothetical protein
MEDAEIINSKWCRTIGDDLDRIRHYLSELDGCILAK